MTDSGRRPTSDPVLLPPPVRAGGAPAIPTPPAPEAPPAGDASPAPAADGASAANRPYAAAASAHTADTRPLPGPGDLKGATDRTRVIVPAIAAESTLTVGKPRKDLTRGRVGRHLNRFGWPLVFGMLMMAGFNLVDIFIIGTLDNPGAKITVVGLCDAIMTLWVVLVNGLGNAVIAYVSRHIGRGNRAAARHAATQSMVLIVLLSVLVVGLGAYFTRPILEAFGAEGTVLAIGESYLRIAFFGGAGMFLVVQMTSILRGVGNAIWPAVTMGLITLLNVILAIVFVRPDWLGLTYGSLDVVGGAIATLVARLVGLLVCVMVFIFGIGRHYIHWHPRHWAPDWRVISRLLVVGLPSSAQLLVRVGVVLVIYRIILRNFSSANNDVAAAFTIASKLDLIALFAAMGWGQAAGTLVGQLLGAGKVARAERATWIALRICTIMMAAIGVVFFIFAPALIQVFNQGAGPVGVAASSVVSEGAHYIRVMVFAYPLIGVGVVISQAFTGAGATLIPVTIDALGLLVGQVAAVLIAIHVFGAGTTVVWAMMAISFAWLAAAYLWAFSKDWWKTKTLA